MTTRDPPLSASRRHTENLGSPPEDSTRWWQAARAAVSLTRPRRSLGAAVAVLVGVRVGGHSTLTETVAGCVAAVSLVAYAQVVNDIADIELDRALKPQRALWSGRPTTTFARRLAAALAGGCLVAGASGGLLLFLLSLVGLGLAMSYSHGLKSTLLLGNVVVAAVSGSTVVFGVPLSRQPNGPVLAAASLVAVFILGNEMFKGSDGAFGIRTVATVGGDRAVAVVITACAAGADALVCWLSFQESFGVAARVALLSVAVPVTAGAALAISQAWSVAGRTGIAGWCYRAPWWPGLLRLFYIRT